MPTFTDLSRTSQQDCTFSFTNYNRKVFDPTWAFPPGMYLQNTAFDFTIGGHYNCSARVRDFPVVTQPGGPGTTWSWSLYARVTVTNGHGASTTSDILLASAGPFAAGTTQDITLGAISGTFHFEVPSDIKYDVTETATAVLDFPPYTTYKQYERSTVGGTAICQVTISGTTVSASSTVSSAIATDYRFDCNVTQFLKGGAVSGISLLSFSGMTTNLLAMPGYAHLNFISSDFYATHTGPSAEFKNIGTDDAFGDPQNSTITSTMAEAQERKMKLLGKINAFDITYPQSLQIKITGFDNAGAGNRTITRTGSYDETDTFYDYSLTSTLLAYPGSGPVTVNTGPVYTVPASLKTEIIAATLTSNGDDPKYTRLPFRGWNFPGAIMTLANETEITAGGTTNTRAFTGLGENFNSYRWLEIEVKSNTGTLQSDILSLTCQPTSDIKTWSFSTSSATFERKRIDLLIPVNKTLGIDDQDDPYPRLNPTGSNPLQERTNKDWYGVTRLSQLSIANANITLGRVFLVADTQTEQSNFCFAPEYYIKYQSDDTSGTTYLGRRLWTQDTSGKNEEEFDVFKVGGVLTAANQTITNFVARVVANHKGWTASAATASGSGRLSYVNSVSGYACWLGGITYKSDIGGGTVQKDYFNVYQQQGEADTTVLGQTIYDEFITNELIPDYGDPFGIWKNTSFPLITLASTSILRGQTHGTIISSAKTPANGEVVNLLLTTGLSNRGSGTTNILGNYYTGAPRALSYKNHINEYTAGAQQKALNPMYAAKRYRTSFFPSIVIGGCLSADESPIHTHAFSEVASNVLKLYLTEQPTPTSYYSTIVPISLVSCAKMKYSQKLNEHRILFCVAHTDGSIKKYYSNDDGESVSVAITLGTGSSPAVATDDSGLEYYFWRTTTGNLMRAVYDIQGNVFHAASAIVSSTCEDKGIGAYVRLNKVIVVYSDTSLGLRQLSSTNDGETFS
jgi:hypothetical protein